MTELHRLPGENEEQFIWRLGRAKDSGELDMDWEEVANIINREFRANEDEYRVSSAYRKPYQQAKRFYESGVFESLTGDQYVEQIRESTRELEKEKIKVQTEKLELYRWKREDARDELMAEKFIAAMLQMPEVTFPEYKCNRVFGSRSAVLAFGDEHYGADLRILGLRGEVINEYSPEIFEERMQNLLTQTIDTVKREQITDLHVFSMGDFTDGILRVGQLMKLRYGVIEGTVKYANYITYWLNELSKHVTVHYQMVFGNHSELRFFNQKKGSFSDENTGLFVRELIKARLDGNPNFNMTVNPTGLIFDTIEGYNILGIHGEVRNMETALKDFSMTYSTPIDILIGGHMHHYKGETVGVDKEVVNVPSIIGIDSYAISLNKTSRPGATFLVIEEGKGISIEYKIKL